MEILSALSRWIHVLAGIVWIGMLYFFNFVNGPFQGTQDGDTKKKVNPELLPRALFWFRWGAAWTWVTGVLLLQLVFYHGGAHRSTRCAAGAPRAIAMIARRPSWRRSSTTRSQRAARQEPEGLRRASPSCWSSCDLPDAATPASATAPTTSTWRRCFGTIMAFNVWFRIWPAQQKIMRAVKEGTAPDAALVALAGSRSRHNTYMSVPLFWGMINAPHHLLLGRQPRHPASRCLRRLPGRDPHRLAHRLASLQARRQGKGLLTPSDVKRSSAGRARNFAFLTISLSRFFPLFVSVVRFRCSFPLFVSVVRFRCSCAPAP